jgi:hypothetical protein
MTTTLIVLALALFGILLWLRFAPADVDHIHIDPAEVEDAGRGSLRLIGREAPRFPGDPDLVLSELLDIARAEPNTRVLDGSVEEGLITFVSRSAMLGLASYTTVKAVAEVGAVTKVSLAARPRHSWAGGAGANRNRLDRWLAELSFRLEG